MYGIKDGYRENPGPVYFTDNVEAERGELFQPDVYAMAELLVQLCGMDTIVDVGCGQATKLALIRERHPEWRYIGVDYGGNLDVCRARYPWGEWVEHDLEHHIALSGLRDVGACVTVCSDVIEHLVDPDPLVRSLWTFAHGHGPVVLSTPEPRRAARLRPHGAEPQRVPRTRVERPRAERLAGGQRARRRLARAHTGY